VITVKADILTTALLGITTYNSKSFLLVIGFKATFAEVIKFADAKLYKFYRTFVRGMFHVYVFLLNLMRIKMSKPC